MARHLIDEIRAMRMMKSCPFCGGAARLDNDDCGPSDDDVSWWPECENKQCVIYGCKIGGPDYATAEAAIAAWNVRAPDRDG